MTEHDHEREPTPEVEQAAQVEETGTGEAASAGIVGTTAVPEPSATKPVRRGRVAKVTTVVLLVAAVVAGVAYTVHVVRNADRDAEAPEWKFPSRRLDGQGAGASGNGLGGMLVPYGTDVWTRGPDIGEFGSDAELGGAQASALRKESLGDLPRSERAELQKEYDKHPVKGMAMRSYYNSDLGRLGEDKEVFAADVLLTRMDSRAQARTLSTVQNELFESLDVFREGPSVKGHKDARCFLEPKNDDSDLTGGYCSAHVGDVLVVVSAEGPGPLDTKGLASLMGEQLDRIADPGEAV